MEMAQRLADRSAADAKLARELLLDERAGRRQSATDDEVAKLCIDLSADCCSTNRRRRARSRCLLHGFSASAQCDARAVTHDARARLSMSGSS